MTGFAFNDIGYLKMYYGSRIRKNRHSRHEWGCHGGFIEHEIVK